MVLLRVIPIIEDEDEDEDEDEVVGSPQLAVGSLDFGGSQLFVFETNFQTVSLTYLTAATQYTQIFYDHFVIRNIFWNALKNNVYSFYIFPSSLKIQIYRYL